MVEEFSLENWPKSPGSRPSTFVRSFGQLVWIQLDDWMLINGITLQFHSISAYKSRRKRFSTAHSYCFGRWYMSSTFWLFQNGRLQMDDFVQWVICWSCFLLAFSFSFLHHSFAHSFDPILIHLLSTKQFQQKRSILIRTYEIRKCIYGVWVFSCRLR